MGPMKQALILAAPFWFAFCILLACRLNRRYQRGLPSPLGGGEETQEGN